MLFVGTFPFAKLEVVLVCTLCTAFVLLSCVNCWCRVLHGSARGSSFPSSTQQTQSTFGSSYSLSSTSTHFIQQCFSCLRRESLPLCQHDQTPISASKHLCPWLLKKPSGSSLQLLISTSISAIWAQCHSCSTANPVLNCAHRNLSMLRSHYHLRLVYVYLSKPPKDLDVAHCALCNTFGE